MGLLVILGLVEGIFIGVFQVGVWNDYLILTFGMILIIFFLICIIIFNCTCYGARIMN
jgi:hypothetical protein